MASKLGNVLLMNFQKSTVAIELLIFLGSIAACISVSFYLLVTQGQYSLLYYGDSISHLVIARRVIDSIIPGFIQLGGVWLPMTHLMLLPFVINDTLFHTGLAGTMVSSISTAFTALLLFRIASAQFNSTKLGILCSVLFMLNPSVVYMGIVPMMEAPFIMFFMLGVYYFHAWYYSYANKRRSCVSQYMILLKCALAISAACLTRYEGWLLPFGLVLAILAVYIFVTNERQKCRIEPLVAFASALSVFGIILWLLWNTVIFKDPMFFANGQYSAAVQAASRPYSSHLHMHPIASLVIMSNVASAMYGLPVLIISLVGIIAHFFANGRNQLFFRLLLVVALMTPIMADFAAMLQGSGEIYPVGDKSWFNGRYLVFVSPVIAFGSTSVIFFVNKRIIKEARERKSALIRIIPVTFVIFCYSIILIAQPFEVGNTTAMSDSYTSLLPSRKVDSFNYETGITIGKLYAQGGGEENDTQSIVLFTPNQVGQEIMFASNLPLRKFIDVSAGTYWDTSRVSPWIYGKYLILAKPTQSQNANSDPELKTIRYWQTHEVYLFKFYRVNYENQYFCILTKK